MNGRTKLPGNRKPETSAKGKSTKFHLVSYHCDQDGSEVDESPTKINSVLLLNFHVEPTILEFQKPPPQAEWYLELGRKPVPTGAIACPLPGPSHIRLPLRINKLAY